MIGGITVGLAATVAAYFVVPPPKYTVKALIHVASSPARIIFQTSESVPNYASYQKTQATLAKSGKVLRAALRQPEVAGLRSIPSESDATSWLDKELKVEFPGGAEIMTVTMTGADPRDLTILVNAVCDAYLKHIVEEERRDRVTRYDSLKTLFNKLQEELREKRKTYRVSVEDVGVTDKLSVATRQQTATQNLGQLQIELSQLQAEIRQMQRKSKLAEASREESGTVAMGPSSDELADQAVARDPEILALRKAHGDLETKLVDVTRLVRDSNDPSVRRAKDRLEANEKAMRRRTTEVRDGAIRAATRDVQALGDRQRVEADQTLSILVEQEKTLREQVVALGSDLKSGNVKVLDMNWLDDEIALTSQAARTVGAEVEALNVELSAQPRIRLLERAETPVLSDPMRRYKVSGATGIACLCLFAGSVVFLEARARRVGSTQEIDHGLGIRLIGSIPARPKARQLRKNGEAWQRMLIESVDAARTIILHASRQEPLKVIMIASAVKGEGKTTLSCLLAASLLRAGKRTLLIDGDLRCPSIHRLMDIPPVAGLCELLRGDANVDDVIIPSAGVGVDFLPAGRANTEALSGLADGRMGMLLDSLRDRYDQIVIDSAPTLYVPDGLMIAQHVDGVVLAVLRDISQAPKVYAAHERLTDLGVRVLGAVVGGTKGEESRGYAYQYARGVVSESHNDG
jgi:capsular exopolysaccharide synthesis family protein